MAKLTESIGRVPAEVGQRTGKVLRSPLFLLGMAGALVATLLVPALSFLLVGGLLAGAAYAVRPLLPGRLGMPRLSIWNGNSSRGVSRPRVPSVRRSSKSPSQTLASRREERGQISRRTSDTPKERVPKGRKVGDPMVDSLIKKLGAAGLVVSTDWQFAKKILNELPDKYNFLRHKKGSVYGFVFNGVIYINPKTKAVATPIHEYTHVWAEVLRQKNLQEWKHIVDMLKNDLECKKLWNDIKKAYPHLETDDEVADEVLATYSGRHGAALLREQYGEGVEPQTVFEKVEQTLRRFWNDVCTFFDVHYTDKEDIADKVLADFIQGVNPLDYAVEGKEKLSDRFPLHEINTSNQNENIEAMNQDNVETKILTGDEARKTVGEILANNPKPGDYVNKEALYPVHLGAVGYFRDTTGTGDMVYSAFDNSTGDCWCEDFKTEEGARKWCAGELGTDEVRELESNVEEIILSRDSFPVLDKPGASEVADLPPYVEFDMNGEFALDMQFFDGYAIDVNPHGLSTADRIGMYYPTVAEVAADPDMQADIEDYTDRSWSEGSVHEQIFDIALKFGQAGRVLCPKERFDAAVDAIVERAADPRAKAFTDEQRNRINLAADCDGFRDKPELREIFFDSLFSHAQEKMQGVPISWANDAHRELQVLSKGEIRQVGGLHR